MPKDKHPVCIAVVGSVPEMKRIDPSDLVDVDEYRIAQFDCPTTDAFWETADAHDIDAVVFDAEELEHPARTLERLRERARNCVSVLVADPAASETLTAASSAGVTEAVVRPAEDEAAASLVGRALSRALSPRHLVQDSPPPWHLDIHRQVYAATSVPFLILDPDYDIRYFNRAMNDVCRENYGVNLQIGQSMYPLLSPDDQPGFSLRFDRAMEGESISIQKDIEGVEGPNLWHRYDYDPIRDDRGEVVAASLSIHDIGSRKRTEQRLKESEARFWTFFKGAQFGMVITDTEGRIVHTNPKFQELLAAPQEELKDEPLLWHVAPEDRERAGDAFESVHAGERANARFEARYQRADGETVWADIVAWPIRDDNGRIQHIVAIVVDITEHKQFEQQMQQAEKMQAVGRMASGFAHEFNNLLMAIVGYAHAIETELPPEAEARRDVEKIESLTEQGGQLTRQLLTYSRHHESNLVELDLNDAIREMSEMLERLFDHDITVRLELSDETPTIEADASQIDQLLMNLALNARDAMPEGGELRFETQPCHIESHDPGDSTLKELGPGTYAKLVVADTGVGMDEQTQRHIFEPFYSTKEVGQGTGLGLALVYGVVDQRGGTISVESSPGEGTTFRLYFPAAENPSAGSRSEEATGDVDEFELPDPPPEASGRSPDATIVIVDDEASVRNALQRYLQERGFRVLTTESAADARALFDEHADTIDLLVADVVMPGESGADLAEDLLESHEELSAIYLSGYTDRELGGWLNVAAARGDLLHKPLSHEKIYRRILEKLD